MRHPIHYMFGSSWVFGEADRTVGTALFEYCKFAEIQNGG